MQIPTFIEELVEAGIPVHLQKGGSFYIEGFYKSGGVLIIKDSKGGWQLKARYGEVSSINFLEDIVQANYNWWQRSKERNEFWQQPDPAWVPLLVQFEFIKEKTIPATVVYE